MTQDAIWIGNDHGGYETKVRIVAYLTEHGYTVNDVGCHSTDIARYPYFAAQVAGAVSRGEAKRGILICSTGIGMSIIANKYPRVRASLCSSAYDGRMTRAHNDSNILCLGGKTTGEFEVIDILEGWLKTEYMGGRHDIALGLIAEAEKSILESGDWQPTGPML